MPHLRPTEHSHQRVVRVRDVVVKGWEMEIMDSGPPQEVFEGAEFVELSLLGAEVVRWVEERIEGGPAYLEHPMGRDDNTF